MNKYTLYNIEKWLGARYILIRNKYEQAHTTPSRRSDSQNGCSRCVPRSNDRFMRKKMLTHLSPKKVSSVLSTVTLGDSLDLVLLSDGV